MRPFARTLALCTLLLAACGDDDDDVAADGDADADSDGDTDADGDGDGDGPLEPIDPCDDAAGAPYDAVPGAAARGELLACTLLETLSADEVATRMQAVPDVTPTGGAVRVYLVAYATERDPGEPGVSTALVYLPDVPAAPRVPLVVSLHGSVGLADVCAPSRLVHDPTSFLGPPYFDALFLAWAARGLPVVAPDYAGLGTAGTHAFDLWADSARSSIDGARALRDLLPVDRQDGGTIVSGHSQGGGVALAVAAESRSAPDLDLVAVVATAPGYRIARAVDILRFDATVLTPEVRVVLAANQVASVANLDDDPAHRGDAIHPDIRDTVLDALDTLCWDDLATALGTATDRFAPPATIAELVDPDFTAAAIACVDDDVCDGLPGQWAARDLGNEPHLDATSPPVLVIASTADESARPGVVGCVRDRIVADGVTPEVCAYDGETHRGLVSSSAGHAISWALAAARGESPPACPGDATIGECSVF